MSTLSTLTRPVVVGVDGDRESEGALRFAVAEAVRRGVPLHLVHVVPSYLSIGPGIPLTDLHEIGMELLNNARDAVAELAPTLHVEATLSHGDPARGIAHAVDHAQLIVVGRESRTGLERLLTGTITASVVAHAMCDVAVVPSFWIQGTGRGRVVVGVKRDRDTERLVSRAFDEAATRTATLTVVHAWDLADPYLDRIEAREYADIWQKQGRELMLHAVESAQERHPELAVELRVQHGTPTQALLDVSADADLLVVGRHRGILGRHARLGSVAHAVLRLSDVPVLVVSEVGDEVAENDVALEAAGAAAK